MADTLKVQLQNALIENEVVTDTHPAAKYIRIYSGGILIGKVQKLNVSTREYERLTHDGKVISGTYDSLILLGD